MFPKDSDTVIFTNSLACDFLRNGRKDIADLLHALNDPAKYSSIFQSAKAEYTKSPEKDGYTYGFVLSLCLDQGYGTKKNKKAAFEIDQYFVKLNHPLALAFVAKDYINGSIVSADFKKAAEYSKKAIDPNQKSFYLPHAIWGEIIVNGKNGIEKNEAEGLRLLKLAEQNGISYASYVLAGYFLEKAEDLSVEIIQNPNSDLSETEIKKINDQAYFYAKKLYELNLPVGKLLYAICYKEGFGIAKDLKRYLEFIRQCAMEGFTLANRLLASVYEFGIKGILKPNVIESLKLYFESFRGNSDNATESFINNFKALVSKNINNLEFMNIAYELFKKCLQGHLEGNPFDSTTVGLFYKNGIIVAPNMQKTLVCFKKAAELEVEKAATELVLFAQSETYGGLLSISEVQRYFDYADKEDITSICKHYHTNFMPLFNSLEEIWPTIIADKYLIMPPDVTRLIVEYADTIIDEQNNKKKKTETAAIS